VSVQELRRGLEPFWVVAGCAGRVGHVMAIFAPDEPAWDGRGGHVARCALRLRPPSPVEAPQRRLGVGHVGAGARRQRGRVGVVRLQAALVCRGLRRRQQIVAGLVVDASDSGLKLRGGGIELVVRGMVARVGELVVHEYVVTPWSTAADQTCSQQGQGAYSYSYCL